MADYPVVLTFDLPPSLFSNPVADLAGTLTTGISGALSVIGASGALTTSIAGAVTPPGITGDIDPDDLDGQAGC